MNTTAKCEYNAMVVSKSRTTDFSSAHHETELALRIIIMITTKFFFWSSWRVWIHYRVESWRNKKPRGVFSDCQRCKACNASILCCYTIAVFLIFHRAKQLC